MDKKLLKKIYENTPSENWHLKNTNRLSPFYNSLPTKKNNGKLVFMFDFVNTLKTNRIGIIKESRYTTIPPHLHKDMEMNYIFSGKCEFLINGRKITLNKGDICILDTQVVNSAEYKNADDIVFNIIFKKEFFSSTFLSQFNDSDTLSKFLLNAILNKKETDNFLIFHTFNLSSFRKVFNLILEEYYFPKKNSINIIEKYCSVLFFYLSRLIGDSNQNLITNNFDKNILLILQEIEKNDGNCSLKELSKKIHFSPSTISKSLKKSTGKNFSQIKIEAQLKKAKLLLNETSMPVLDIMLAVGIKNTTFFYNKFFEKFGETPKNFRKNNKKLQI
ncbi:helix-turn-helix domain-containing protein [Bombilactobacillus bombi]|uniref:AraC family transcriptional regulator n=1 Tax=Bombilactobacillus bombi TaxID=1303590 RepID=UPI000E58E9EF|nr:AraC family transcriptional regulator [Bombilactobacillus bombi]AXX65046.1 helix-turn-helix domain-containing protein [Bombilactobacillus bombi]